MAHTKKFKNPNTDGTLSPISGKSSNKGSWNNHDVGFKNYSTHLPEIYVGHPNRIERYNQMDQMDMDPEINACLDIISEFSTQKNDNNATPFDIEWAGEPVPTEVDIVKKQLQQWCKLNEFDTRMFKLFRNTLKYGDQVLVRDPETFKLFWVDMTKVIKILVDEEKGEKPAQYIIKDINLNLESLTVSQKTSRDHQAMQPGSGVSSGHYQAPDSGSYQTGSSRLGMKESAIDSRHVVHVSLTEGLDRFWPFGQSILETIFKVYKQKELLEDAILIYRVQRAPERRIFKIDVGNMPSHMAMAYVDRVKNEIHQRRIPSTRGGQSNIDATYNPLSINEDYYFPVTAEGRGSSVETLPGGDNLGQIDDLKWFNNRMARGLRIPSSYLPTGPDDNQTPLSDGRVGTAMIQEFRFNQYCKRLQNYICRKLDDEFKLFLRWRGFNIDSGSFSIALTPPQNFAAYRQIELDKDRVSSFQAMEAVPYISKRFALERYLGLTKEEIEENSKLWHEEQDDLTDETPNFTDMRSVGLNPTGISGDMSMGAMPTDMGGSDGMDAAPDTVGEMGDAPAI
jgi:hypothetical protein